jgi:xanthine/uracil permease
MVKPPSVLGGMQVFLYSTIAVAGIRVLGLIAWTRRNRFILTAALGIGFIDIVQPKWFSQILNYSGSNVHLQGLEQGINLIVETPFIVAAVIGAKGQQRYGSGGEGLDWTSSPRREKVGVDMDQS